MTRPPRDLRVRFMDRSLTTAIFASGLSLFAAVAGVYLWASWTGASTAKPQTLAFATWMVGDVLLAWVLRSERTPLWRLGLWSNRFLPIWTAAAAAALATVTAVPAVRTALRLTTLSAAEWALVLGAPLAAVAWLEAAKRWHPRHGQDPAEDPQTAAPRAPAP